MNIFSLRWWTDPLVKIIEYIKTPYTIEVVQEIEFEPAPSTHIYRPETFDEYIGQEKAKSILKDYIKAMKERKQTLPHILIHGQAGCGKTTLAKIIAKTIRKPFREAITSTLVTPYDLLLAIKRVDGGVLFLDEIHAIDRDLAESIYSIMEDFKYNGEPIQPFTLIGATTEIGEMIEDMRPFVDRFRLPIELEDYKDNEIALLSRQYRLNAFPHDNMPLALHNIIARNARKTPRIAIRLTEATCYLKDLNKVLYNFNIIKDGYTHKDLKTLKYIALNEKGVGLQGLVSYLGTSAKNYSHEIEPYLLKNQLLIRTPRGRKITPEGLIKIQELENAGKI